MTAIIDRIISGACKLGCLRCGRGLKVLSVIDGGITVERCDCFKFGFNMSLRLQKTEGEQNGR